MHQSERRNTASATANLECSLLAYREQASRNEQCKLGSTPETKYASNTKFAAQQLLWHLCVFPAVCCSAAANLEESRHACYCNSYCNTAATLTATRHVYMSHAYCCNAYCNKTAQSAQRIDRTRLDSANEIERRSQHDAGMCDMCSKGWQGFTRCCRVLQGVVGCCKVL